MFFCGLPAVGVLLGDDLHVALLHGIGQRVLLAGAQEVGVRVAGRALDHHEAALGLHGQHGPGLQAADFAVVEAQVEDLGRLDQAVIGHDRHLAGLGLVQRRLDRVLVHGQDDQHLGALGQQGLDVGNLLLGRAAGIGRHIAGALAAQLGLHRGLVGLPALLLEIGPAHADHGADRKRFQRSHQQHAGRPHPVHSHLVSNARFFLWAANSRKAGNKKAIPRDRLPSV
jgi:hypothetical protein